MIELTRREKERLFEVFLNELSNIVEEHERDMKKQSKFKVDGGKVCFE